MSAPWPAKGRRKSTKGYNSIARAFLQICLLYTSFVKSAADRVVYWGTSGQRITDRYAFDSFCRGELLEKGKLLLGPEVRGGMALPTREELKRDVTRYYELIRQYAQQTGRSFYSYGWLLDIARGIYTPVSYTHLEVYKRQR